MHIDTALQSSAPLAHLRRLLQESKQRFEVICPHLPPALAAHVRPGPIDENGWTLLAANPAVAAKLRQLQPRLEQALSAGGWQGNAIRVKVQTG